MAWILALKVVSSGKGTEDLIAKVKFSQLFVVYLVSNLNFNSSPTATPPLVTVETIFAPLGLTCSLVLGQSTGGNVVVVIGGVGVVVIKVHE